MVELGIACVRSINYFLELPSTQDYAMRLAEGGAGEGTLVVSEVQTRGKGRAGNTWFSPKGGLWFSFILKPGAAPFHTPLLSLGMSLAVVKSVKKIAGAEVLIKWPNDIIFRGRKLGGVLVNVRTDSGKLRYAVAGIGLNTNVSIAEFPEVLKGEVISLKDAGYSVDNIELLEAVLEEAGRIYGHFKKGIFLPVLKEIKKNCLTLGKRVRATEQDSCSSIKGLAFDISEKGGLLIRADSGAIMEIFSGSATEL